MIVLSYGGGRQSCGLCVLVCEGVLPRPDLIVFADTGRERQRTWDYLEQVMRPYLAKHNLTVEVASHDLATVDLYAKNGDLLVPAFTAESKLPTFCSGEWKREVVARYLRKTKAVKQCEMWLGISYEESRRISTPRHDWYTLRYPLIDLCLTAEGCRKIVTAAGLPDPPQSYCWCCPHAKAAQWLELKETSPAEFAKAVEMDEAIRAADERGGVFLYEGRVPLALADLEGDAKPGKSAPLNLFDMRGCNTGNCWT